MDKYHFLFDKTKRSQKLKKFFKKYKNYPIKKSNIVVVAGGDGFMLRVLKRYYKFCILVKVRKTPKLPKKTFENTTNGNTVLLNK